MAKEEFKIDRSDLLDTNTKTPEVDFSFDDLNTEVEEKLQANYEAQILAVQHPEFREAIKEQLADSDKFNGMLADSIKTIKIKDLTFSNDLAARNDSIFTKKVVYTSLINSKYQQRDSVLVVIKRAMIIIDHKPQINTSFSFERLER
jgi:hypothetical protein